MRREKCFQVSNGNSGAFRVDTGRKRAVAVAGKRQNAPWRRNDVRHVFCHTCSQEEKRKMKEEIERRRAEAAEKRQKVEDNVDEGDRPFKCVSPRGSSLKVGPLLQRRFSSVLNKAPPVRRWWCCSEVPGRLP